MIQLDFLTTLDEYMSPEDVTKPFLEIIKKNKRMSKQKQKAR